MATCDLPQIPTQAEIFPRRPHHRDFPTIGAVEAVVAGIEAPSSTAAADPFAFTRIAGPGADPDAAILRLFRQWLDECRSLDETRERDEDAWDVACDRQWSIEDRIFECRGGPIGLAIKTFLHLYRQTANWTPSAAQLRIEEDQDEVGWMASLLRDAVALVPEIGECAAAVVHDDAVLIDADIGAQWATECLAEPLPRNKPTDPLAEVREGLRKTLERIASTPARTPRGEAIKAKYAGGMLHDRLARRPLQVLPAGEI